MSDLNSNWITEGILDFEYKKYVLLAYLKSCRESFHETKLYPPLGELVKHYNSLNELNASLEQLQNAFPKDLSGFDLAKLQLEYQKEKLNDESITTITEIMEFAIPNFRYIIDEGKEIYELVERNIEIAPLGIVPMYNHEGYILIHADPSPDVHIYRFQHSIIVQATENLRSLSLNYIHKEVKSIANTFEQIKLNLIRKYRELPLPATYLCLCKRDVPMMETLLPVTKRLLLSRIFSQP